LTNIKLFSENESDFSSFFFERWKIGSFAKLGLWVGLCGFENVPMWGGLKLFFKMCGWKIF